MITQENIPYTADEIKAMVKTCEKYNKALEKARELMNKGYDVLMPEIFPELQESKDEMIRKELIEQIAYIIPNDDEVDNEGDVLPSYQERIDKYRAWLEKQKGDKDMTQQEQCKTCREFPPCPKNKCCKKCNVLNCNSRQCENITATRINRKNKLPWYLKS